MAYIREALERIGVAQDEIQQLIRRATKSRAYSELVFLAELAKELQSLRAGFDEPLTGPGTNGPEVKRSPQEKVGGATSRERLPVFLRDGNDLLKIGKAGEGNSPYEHRTSRETLKAIVERILAAAPGADDRFAAKDLMNIQGHKDGKSIPSYQIYMTLGWLTEAGIIRRHGRRGYSMPDRAGVDKRIDDAWKGLAYPDHDGRG